MVDKRPVVLVKIGQLAGIVGVAISKLNFYITAGLLRPARKTASGHRLFDPEEAQETLDRVANLQKAGKTIEEIKKLIRRRRKGSSE